MNNIDIKVKIAPEWLTKIGVLKQIDIDKEKDYSAITIIDSDKLLKRR